MRHSEKPVYNSDEIAIFGDVLHRAAQRVGIQLPRARCQQVPKSARSRARSGQLQCLVRPQPTIALSQRDAAKHEATTDVTGLTEISSDRLLLLSDVKVLTELSCE
jgi:hypothetical protein